MAFEKSKKIISEIDGWYSIVKVNYQEWCGHLYISGYFLPESILNQPVNEIVDSVYYD